ncbi:MAG: hypothetical protein KAH05_06580 [Clostridiales bacterium]|nr:hypothetical protein [Clostridiales bacterium]
MIKMIEIKRVIDEFKKNNGILKTIQLKSIDLTYRDINKLIATNKIKRIKNGYYKIADDELSEIEMIAGLYPDGILCMDSALFYYGYSDKTPLEWTIAFNKDTSKTRFKIDYPFIKPYFIEPSILNLGVSEADYEVCSMKIYNRDRLICDCLKYENKMDKETFNKAIQYYLADPKKNIANLIDYAKIRRVSKKLHNIIGVWL